jgi:geranylgeranyl transferase type-2 subunit beta
VTNGYLDLLDTLLRIGLSPLSHRTTQPHVAYVIGRQRPDGGFPAREGPSDVYYSDFAVRVLTFLAPGHPALVRAAGYISGVAPPPRDVVDCFGLLNCERLLRGGGIEAEVAREPIHAVLERQLQPRGGFARPGFEGVSAYHTFIAALCCEALGQPVPAAELAVEAVGGLQMRNGGFAEQAGQGLAQTSATAAATAFLTITDAITPGQRDGAVRFLASMQSADGGLRAHEHVARGDLLSTFTGLLALGGADGLEGVDLPSVGRFVRDCALPTGGFGSCPADPGADIEYTFYGIGCLAVLRAAVEGLSASALGA